MAADAAVRNLQQALDEMRESRDSEAMFQAIGYTLLATLVLAGLLWADHAGLQRSLARRIRAFVQLRSEKLAPSWSQQVVGQSGIADLAVVPVKLVAWAAALLLVYEWAALVLEFFPYTRPWGEGLFDNLLGALGRFGRNILQRGARTAVRRTDLLRHALHRARRARLLRRRAGRPHRRRLDRRNHGAPHRASC